MLPGAALTDVTFVKNKEGHEGGSKDATTTVLDPLSYAADHV